MTFQSISKFQRTAFLNNDYILTNCTRTHFLVLRVFCWFIKMIRIFNFTESILSAFCLMKRELGSNEMVSTSFASTVFLKSCRFIVMNLKHSVLSSSANSMWRRSRFPFRIFIPFVPKYENGFCKLHSNSNFHGIHWITADKIWSRKEKWHWQSIYCCFELK